VKVVAGVIARGGRLFLQQRVPTRDFPFMWESPGGKVEAWDASLRDALLRELHEELRFGKGSGVAASLPFFEASIDLGGGRKVEISYFRVRAADDWKPELVDAAGGGWFTLEEMAAMRWALIPGNVALLRFLQDERARLLMKASDPTET